MDNAPAEIMLKFCVISEVHPSIKKNNCSATCNLMESIIWSF